jgi:hypothetical protein
MRRDCSYVCDACSYLRSDRRQQTAVLSLDFWERRRVSNLLPVSGQLAIAGGAVLTDQSPGRQYAGAILGLLIAFNILDALLTMRAFSLGVEEANPIMAGIFNFSLPLGILAKVCVVSSGALILWKYRYLPLASRGMNLLTACYGAVVIYHLSFQLGSL